MAVSGTCDEVNGLKGKSLDGLCGLCQLPECLFKVIGDAQPTSKIALIWISALPIFLQHIY